MQLGVKHTEQYAQGDLTPQMIRVPELCPNKAAYNYVKTSSSHQHDNRTSSLT